MDAVAAEIRGRGRRTLSMPADAAEVESLERLRDACLKELGGIHIMVYAAGVTRRVPTLDMDVAEWERILDTNLTGALRACQVFGRPMIEAKVRPDHHHRVVDLVRRACSKWRRTRASKSGIAGLTRALAVEWASSNVTVNAIAPGVFRTDLNSALLDSPRGQELLTRTPMQRFGKLEELAGAAVFLASDAASFVTGHLLAVDGGFLASGVNQ